MKKFSLGAVLFGFLCCVSQTHAAIIELTQSGRYTYAYDDDRSEDHPIDAPFTYTQTYDTSALTSPHNVDFSAYFVSTLYFPRSEPGFIRTGFGLTSGNLFSFRFTNTPVTGYPSLPIASAAFSLHLTKPFDLSAPALDIGLDPNVPSLTRYRIDYYTDHRSWSGVITGFSYTVDGVANSPAAVAEPGTWAIILVGLFAIGGTFARSHAGTGRMVSKLFRTSRRETFGLG